MLLSFHAVVLDPNRLRDEYRQGSILRFDELCARNAVRFVLDCIRRFGLERQ